MADGSTVVSPAQEFVLGEKALNEFFATHPLDGDGALALRLDRIGKKIADASDRPNLPYRFWVVQGTDLQAYSFPGGTVCLTRALCDLYASDDDLAFALAHELAHIALRHHIGQLRLEEIVEATKPEKRVLPLLEAVKNRMGRDTEMEADRFGALYAVRAGYRYSASFQSLRNLARASPSRAGDSTHPLYADRISALEKFKDELERSIDAFKRGVSSLEKGTADDAITYMSLFVAQFPNSSAGLINLGAAYLSRARQKSGTPEDLAEFLPILPDTDVVLRGPGDLIDVQKARDNFAHAARINGDSALALAGLALAALRLGDVAQARNALTRARDLDPASADLTLCLGNVEYLDKHYEKAAQLYMEALSHRADWAAARKNLAMTYEKRGDVPRASTEWNVLISDVKFGELARRRLQALKIAPAERIGHE